MRVIKVQYMNVEAPSGEKKKVKIKKNNQKSLLYTNFNFFMFSVSLTYFYVDFQKLILHNVVVTTVF